MDELSGSSDSDSEVEDLNSTYKKLEFLRSHKDFKHLIAKEKEVGRGSTSREKLALKIDPDFTGTFLMNPQNFDSRKDTIGLWPPKVIFPRPNEAYTPSKSACNISNVPVWPKRLPIKFRNSNTENFLTAGQLTDKNKAQLDLSVHDLGSVQLAPFENFSIQDKILRNGLIDNAITDTLIEAGTNRLNALSENWDYVFDLIMKGKIDFKRELKFLMEIGGLAFASNQRNRNAVSAALTNNKIQLRDQVLSKTKGSSQTKDKLRLSNLASPHIFGELPESFKSTLNAAAANPYSNLVLKNKRSYGSYNSYYNSQVPYYVKRRALDQGYNRGAKRGRPSSSRVINFAESASYIKREGNTDNSGVFQSAPRPQLHRGRGNPRRGQRGYKPGRS